jgi:hypothetical protein
MRRLVKGWTLGAVSGVALWSGVAYAQATTASKNLEKCQKTAQTETAKYATAVQKKLGDCLEKIASVVVAGNQSTVDVSGATKICLTKLYDLGRVDGKSLADKMDTKIHKACDDPPVLPADIVGTGTPDVNQPLNTASRIGGYCGKLVVGAGSLADWISCLRAAAECQARQQVAVDFPRGPEWLRLMDTQFGLSLDAKAPRAQAALQSAHHAMDANNDDKPDLACVGQRPPLATGQTDTYGTGSDGALQKGATRSFTDNGDGTITDNTTGLLWEKKDDSDGIHDKDNTYTWGMTSTPYTMNGTMVTAFLAALNAGAGFAGHKDWRIPNINELLSIANYQYAPIAVEPAFNTACTSGCQTTHCSCTAYPNRPYWSSTTVYYDPDDVCYWNCAWLVSYDAGTTGFNGKEQSRYVRAVRGGR